MRMESLFCDLLHPIHPREFGNLKEVTTGHNFSVALYSNFFGVFVIIHVVPTYLPLCGCLVADKAALDENRSFGR